MLPVDKTSERLRSKHVRTLELLQKTLDENVELRDKIGQLQRGALHLSQGIPRPSNRTNELEDEIDRLKAEHYSKLLATEEAAKVRQDELARAIDTLQSQQQKLQNEVFNLETRLYGVRETLQTERHQWQQERHQLQQENRTLQHELQRLCVGSEDNQERHQAELTSLQRELELREQNQMQIIDRNQRLEDEIKMLYAEVRDHKTVMKQQQHQLEEIQTQVAGLKSREDVLTSEILSYRERNNELQTKLNHLQVLNSQSPRNGPTSLTPSASQQQLQHHYSSTLAQLQQVEDQNSRLVAENRTLQESFTKVQTQLSELLRSNNQGTSSIFATHIDLKRENHHLRSQVEELKQIQRKFLTTAKKKTMSFPAI